MKDDILVALKEAIAEIERTTEGEINPSKIRDKLEEKGLPERSISDALFLLDYITGTSRNSAVQRKTTRVLSIEELQGLSSAVVGKMFRLYYLDYINKDQLERVMSELLFVPSELQDERARVQLVDLLSLSTAQVDFIFDGGIDSAAIH